MSAVLSVPLSDLTLEALRSEARRTASTPERVAADRLDQALRVTPHRNGRTDASIRMDDEADPLAWPPPHDVGLTDPDFTFRREDLYGDDGR